MSEVKSYLLSFTTLFYHKKGYVLSLNRHESVLNLDVFPVEFDPWNRYPAIIMRDLKESTKVKRSVDVVRSTDSNFKTVLEGFDPGDLQAGSVLYLSDLSELLAESRKAAIESGSERLTDVSTLPFYESLGNVLEEVAGRSSLSVDLSKLSPLVKVSENGEELPVFDKADSLVYGEQLRQDLVSKLVDLVDGEMGEVELMTLLFKQGYNQVTELSDRLFNQGEMSATERMMEIQYGNKAIEMAKANFVKSLVGNLVGLAEEGYKVDVLYSNDPMVVEVSKVVGMGYLDEFSDVSLSKKDTEIVDLNDSSYFTSNLPAETVAYIGTINIKKNLDDLRIEGGKAVVHNLTGTDKLSGTNTPSIFQGEINHQDIPKVFAQTLVSDFELSDSISRYDGRLSDFLDSVYSWGHGIAELDVSIAAGDSQVTGDIVETDSGGTSSILYADFEQFSDSVYNLKLDKPLELEGMTQFYETRMESDGNPAANISFKESNNTSYSLVSTTKWGDLPDQAETTTQTLVVDTPDDRLEDGIVIFSSDKDDSAMEEGYSLSFADKVDSQSPAWYVYKDVSDLSLESSYKFTYGKEGDPWDKGEMHSLGYSLDLEGTDSSSIAFGETLGMDTSGSTFKFGGVEESAETIMFNLGVDSDYQAADTVLYGRELEEQSLADLIKDGTMDNLEVIDHRVAPEGTMHELSDSSVFRLALLDVINQALYEKILYGGEIEMSKATAFKNAIKPDTPTRPTNTKEGAYEHSVTASGFGVEGDVDDFSKSIGGIKHGLHGDKTEETTLFLRAVTDYLSSSDSVTREGEVSDMDKTQTVLQAVTDLLSESDTKLPLYGDLEGVEWITKFSKIEVMEFDSTVGDTFKLAEDIHEFGDGGMVSYGAKDELSDLIKLSVLGEMVGEFGDGNQFEYTDMVGGDNGELISKPAELMEYSKMDKLATLGALSTILNGEPDFVQFGTYEDLSAAGKFSYLLSPLPQLLEKGKDLPKFGTLENQEGASKSMYLEGTQDTFETTHSQAIIRGDMTELDSLDKTITYEGESSDTFHLGMTLMIDAEISGVGKSTPIREVDMTRTDGFTMQEITKDVVFEVNDLAELDRTDDIFMDGIEFTAPVPGFAYDVEVGGSESAIYLEPVIDSDISVAEDSNLIAPTLNVEINLPGEGSYIEDEYDIYLGDFEFSDRVEVTVNVSIEQTESVILSESFDDVNIESTEFSNLRGQAKDVEFTIGGMGRKQENDLAVFVDLAETFNSIGTLFDVSIGSDIFGALPENPQDVSVETIVLADDLRRLVDVQVEIAEQGKNYENVSDVSLSVTESGEVDGEKDVTVEFSELSISVLPDKEVDLSEIGFGIAATPDKDVYVLESDMAGFGENDRDVSIEFSDIAETSSNQDIYLGTVSMAAIGGTDDVELETPDMGHAHGIDDVIVETSELAGMEQTKDTAVHVLDRFNGFAGERETSIEVLDLFDPSESSNEITIEIPSTAIGEGMAEVTIENNDLGNSVGGVDVVIGQTELSQGSNSYHDVSVVETETGGTNSLVDVLVTETEMADTDSYSDVVIEGIDLALTESYSDVVIESADLSSTNSESDVVIEDIDMAETGATSDVVIEDIDLAETGSTSDVDIVDVDLAETGSTSDVVIVGGDLAETGSTSDVVVAEGELAETVANFDMVIEQPDFGESTSYSDVVLENEDLAESHAESDVIIQITELADGSNTYDTVVETGELAESERVDEVLIDEPILATMEVFLDVVVEEFTAADRRRVRIMAIEGEEESSYSSSKLIDIYEEDEVKRDGLTIMVMDEEEESSKSNSFNITISGEEVGANDREFAIDIDDDDMGVGMLPPELPWDEPTTKGKSWLIMGKNYPAWNNWNPKKTR